jgi:hypothetical protein
MAERLEGRARRTPIARRLAVLIGCLVLASFFAESANAWEDPYVVNEYYSAGAWDYSGYNSSLKYNSVSFWNEEGGLPQMGTRYRRGDGSVYSWIWSNTGWLYDDRTVSYGRGECQANTGNNYIVFVYLCRTTNVLP